LSILQRQYLSAGGVHGGNRPGGNAVTDVVVFGKQAGETLLSNENKTARF